MSLNLAMDIILVILAAILTLFFVYVLIQLSKTLGSINELIKDVNKQVPSLLEKLQITIDEVNSELGQVGEIVKSVEEISDKVNTTTNVVQEIISSPLIKLASFSAGAKKAISTLIKEKKK